jgi:hypothetical protein
MGANLDVISLVVITALPEQPVGYHPVHIKLIEDGVSVLSRG